MLRQVVPTVYNDDNPYSLLSELSDIGENVPHYNQSVAPKKKKIPMSKSVKKAEPG